jgi:amino acid permease
VAPVLMTAFTSSLALIPLALSAGEPGREILHPVALVVLGGLLTSTALDFFVTPTVFLRFGRKAAERLVALHRSESQVSLSQSTSEVGSGVQTVAHVVSTDGQIAADVPSTPNQ